MAISFNTTLSRFTDVMVLSFILTGCATWAGHGITTYPHEKLRIAVLPVINEVEITKIKDIETVPEPEKENSNKKVRIKQQMEKVTEDMTRSIEGKQNIDGFLSRHGANFHMKDA